MNKIFVALLAGIAIGLLAAPAKGSETWRRLVDGFDDYKDKAEDEAEGVYESGNSFVKKGRSKLQRKAEELADQTNP